MNIAEMHVWFRQYAQQMGMQNVRAILPEQIDMLINTAINDYVNQLIKENVGVSQDRIITDNSKIGEINILKTLYKVSEIPFFSHIDPNRTYNLGSVNSETFAYGILSLHSYNKIVVTFKSDKSYNNAKINMVLPNDDSASFSKTVNIQAGDNRFEITGFTYDINNRTYYISFDTDGATLIMSNFQIEVIDTRIDNGWTFNDKQAKLGLLKNINDIDSLFLVDFSINYIKSKKGLPVTNGINVLLSANPTFETTDETNWFPVRLISDAYLADTMNDFVLKNRIRTPILVIINNMYNLYIEKFIKDNITDTYFLPNKLIPYKFRVSYISKPRKVKYAEDINGDNVDCDLPENTHIDILKHAVDLYHIAIQGDIHAASQQDRQQQQEMVRNTAQPDAGYRQNVQQ
jgi:hypothetical protein